MSGSKSLGPAGENNYESNVPTVVNRRLFLRGASLLGIATVLGLFRSSVSHALVRPNFYQKAWARRNFTAKPIVVYKMVGLPDRRYCNADLGHMTNKVFPSIEAARGRRLHRAFFYGLQPVQLPRALINGMNKKVLFCGRKDLDPRVFRDRRHLQKLGINIAALIAAIQRV